MKRRVFLAIPAPHAVREVVDAWGQRHRELGVRWLKPENLHITVVPPWYAAEEELRHTIAAVAESAAAVNPFAARFTKVLFGPPGGTPRLIWAEGETPQEFQSLKSVIEDTLFSRPESGFMKKEKRLAKLHLTIARFRPGSLKKFLVLDGEISWSFEVKEIVLMESELKRTGAEYIPLFRFALGA